MKNQSTCVVGQALAVMLCFLLAGCAGGGGVSGGTSGSSGTSSGTTAKVEKPDPPECNAELYLPAHMPEHCKPEEKLAASKSGSVKQKAPDPIVGTYHVYSLEDSRESVLRVYPNGRAVLGYFNYRWRYEKGAYLISWGDNYRFTMKYQKARGEPELATLNDAPIYGQFEALKVSADPDFLFDLYKLAIVRKEPSSMACFNLGRKEYRYQEIPKELGYPSFHSSSLTDCEASCQPFRDGHKELKDKRCPGEADIERDALVALYLSTDGDKWKNKDGWLTADDHCEWYGVTCEAGKVDRLNLLNNGLKGLLPADLANLPELKALNVYSNRISGEFPTSLQHLVRLERINLTANLFHGPLPHWLGDLKNLWWLGVAHNRFNGDIPSSLARTKLYQVYFNNNDFTGTFPSWSSSISWSDFSNNSLINFDSNGLEKFDDLRHESAVRLSRNNFACPFPAVFVPYFAYQGEVCVEGNIVDNYTGELKGNYLTGEKKFHYIYVKGKLNGVSFRWYKNGQTAEVRNYSHGKKHGVQVSYYETGQLEESSHYTEGKLNGLLENFRKDGAYRVPPSCHEKGKKVDVAKCSSQKPTPPIQ